MECNDAQTSLLPKDVNELIDCLAQSAELIIYFYPYRLKCSLCRMRAFPSG